jgi:hypothetical protein
VNYARLSSFFIVGFLALAAVSEAKDGHFTGNLEEDWAFVRKNFVQNWRDPKVCSEDSLYLEQEVSAAVGKYVTPFAADASVTGNALAACSGTTESESLLPSAAQTRLIKDLEPVLATEPKDVACVAAAQKFYAPIGRKASCESADAKPTPRKNPPCRSDAYTLGVTRAFSLVTQCLGADAREMFKLFVKESGMGLNAVSGTGAAGIGQMTGTAILHVQNVQDGIEGKPASKRLAQQLEKEIHGGTNPKEPANPSCAPLQDFDRTRYTVDTAGANCELLAMPQGLFLSMYYGTKHYLYYQADIRAVAEEGRFKEIFKDDYEEILRVVSMYSYSAAGHYSVLPRFQTLAKLYYGKYKSGPAGKASFLTALKMRIMAGRPKALQEEIDVFISGVNQAGNEGAEEKYRKIKEALGGAECF